MRTPYLLLLVNLALVAASSAAYPQQPTPRIGMVLQGGVEAFEVPLAAFRNKLRDLGYIEGQNISIEYRGYPPERPDLLPGIAKELVQSRVDVMVAISTPEIRALMQATNTIPIVMIGPGDPVGAGLIASLAHPGGNVTGMTFLTGDLSGKRLELLKEAIPGLSRVGVLFNPVNPVVRQDVMQLQAAGRTLGITIHPAEVREPSEFSSAFSSMTGTHDKALVVVIDPITWVNRKVIVDLAARNRLPSIFYTSGFTELGGLMSFGPRGSDNWSEAAVYVAKILKGANPADLPVQQPTLFELVVNLKTAKTLGITFPESILQRADKVIR